ncbi:MULTISPECIES: endonuclease/exonuclease/phosphatase family protein [Curtobacterium]|uniref:endonuclease/exonuclease/phosphatase family protein n=1 Tax=Curtobacterium TaxID=2034 RepID=UPI00188AAF02|nr:MULTISPECIES: endonuclease/exonuclease/phosphatase family protein [Curtobacterium]MBF4605658.1 endonuclease/exonuclease/phosphatase family protein [Curtobacterium sp. VKM Ac-2884]MBT1624151.1 endonuclease/exonuclease/phosphatase family protein [Curtobacterium flaccumfaciens pv. oortii]
MLTRRAVASTVVVSVVVVLGGAFVSAPWLGIARAPVLAAVLPARAVVSVGCVVVAVALIVLGIARRRVRVVAFAVGAVLVALAGTNGVVLEARGFDVEPPRAAGLRVFEWNTNGGLVAPTTIGRAASAARADVVVLPDAGSLAAAEDVADAMRQGGRPVHVFAEPGAQVAVLVRDDLAAHATRRPGIDPVKTLVVSVPGAPTIVAVHAPQPLLRGLAGWRADLDWVRRTCADDAEVVVAGDFNASVDAFGGGGLGACQDAASTVHAASLGTWPTSVVPALAMPLDHTLVSPAVGVIRSWTVVRTEDGSRARHRPTITVIGVRTW